MAGKRPAKLSLSSLNSRDQLDIATIKLDEFNLPEHWKYVTIVLVIAPENTFLIFLEPLQHYYKNKTFKTDCIFVKECNDLMKSLEDRQGVRFLWNQVDFF